MINKILFITLSNIGDAILSLPSLDYLRTSFPEAKITVFTGERTREIFENNPGIDKVILYDKRLKLGEKIGLFTKLYREKFDAIIDLRNSFLGTMLPAKHKIPLLLVIPSALKHMREIHLYKTQCAMPKAKDEIGNLQIQKSSLYIKPEDEEYINRTLRENGISAEDKIMAVSAGARSHIKRWPSDKFLELIAAAAKEFKVNPVRSNALEAEISNGVKIALVGDKDDASIAKYIKEHSQYPILDLSGQTSIMELACLLKNAACIVTNDSAVLHLASYIDAPIAAIFGPTDEEKYGPWSKVNYVVKKDIFCRPCEKAQCKSSDLKCMQLVTVEDVLRGVRKILVTDYRLPITDYRYERILIVRTDRIGDVLLSTPAIKALRETHPNAYIAMMVSPYAKDIVNANPYLDEVIIYDKDGKHKSWLRSIKFGRNLKKKKFDLALVLHPTNRVHLITFFAGIPKRVGYDLKLGFLLTDKIKHTKQCGEKHELDYNLDLVKYLGIEPKDKSLFMPISPESEKSVDLLLRQEGIKDSERLLAIHPGASCPSKVWPNERFAEVTDRLIVKYGFKALVLAGPKDINLAQGVINHMRNQSLNLAGKTSVSQLASILKRCRLFISNDSGPVHIAAAVGTPVISIFGRAQNGLSPKRWGPLGLKDVFLHKTVGCIECLAHNCRKEFACLKAVTVNDVLKAADAILMDEK